MTSYVRGDGIDDDFDFLFKIEDANMSDGDSKDTRSKAKEALLEWVRKKTSGYVMRKYCTFSRYVVINIVSDDEI